VVRQFFLRGIGAVSSFNYCPSPFFGPTLLLRFPSIYSISPRFRLQLSHFQLGLFQSPLLLKKGFLVSFVRPPLPPLPPAHFTPRGFNFACPFWPFNQTSSRGRLPSYALDPLPYIPPFNPYHKFLGIFSSIFPLIIYFFFVCMTDPLFFQRNTFLD